jgi:hypothetical protein
MAAMRTKSSARVVNAPKVALHATFPRACSPTWVPIMHCSAM